MLHPTPFWTAWWTPAAMCTNSLRPRSAYTVHAQERSFQKAGGIGGVTAKRAQLLACKILHELVCSADAQTAGIAPSRGSLGHLDPASTMSGSPMPGPDVTSPESSPKTVGCRIKVGVRKAL